jgi:hypothetical protein
LSGPADHGRLGRREAIQWMLAAAASLAVLDRSGLRAGEMPAGSRGAKGYGTDPDLLRTYQPGEVWPLRFTAAESALATVLCDLIIPADDHGPAASAVGVPAFVDEWISAPYPGHDEDRRRVREGLAWIDAEARRRFGDGFAKVDDARRRAIADDIRHVPDAKADLQEAARFFALYRNLTAGGYYTTPAGMKDIGYVGNVPTVTFDGPPPEVLRRLGLA